MHESERKRKKEARERDETRSRQVGRVRERGRGQVELRSCAISSLIFLIKIGLPRPRVHLNRHTILGDLRISYSKLTVTIDVTVDNTLSEVLSKKISKRKVPILGHWL